MGHILRFDDPSAIEISCSGGKGSSLSRLARAGFPVPPGFVISTDAYGQFITANGLQPEILGTLARTDFADFNALEDTTAKIRSTVSAAPMPEALGEEILRAYHALGDSPFVAVRSSGTAEDLAEASFAGQHDSYLDVRGDTDVLDAVRRCWASLWTGRACGYRQQKGFDHGEVRLAVVVQLMISSEVAGVMFTANPLSTAVDEYLVNASWGLGEGIVSGALTPDQFTLDRGRYGVKARELGTKAIRVVRDAEAGSGVLHEEVPLADRDRYCLTDAQLAELGSLGTRVTDFYGQWPQDIEWAFADGRLYLLQSRDVTGVDFSWDEDLDEYTVHDPFEPEAVFSRKYADDLWVGRKTPLFYSVRAECAQKMMSVCLDQWQLPPARGWKYHKGETYVNSEISYGLLAHNQPKMLHDPEMLLWTPPAWAERLEKEPGASWVRIAKMAARIKLMDPSLGIFSAFKVNDHMMENEGELMLGLSPEQLRQLGDRELVRHLEKTITMMGDWYVRLFTPMFLYAQWVGGAFSWILKKWYTGGNEMIFADLITGLPRHTWVMKENLALWRLAEKIRHSEALRATFADNRDGDFFTACAESEEGRDFLTSYTEFLEVYGHRGHAERDAWYPRRVEDPSIDYLNFEILLGGAEGVVPGATEDRLIAQRDAAAAEVIECIKKQPLSTPKVELFKLLHDWMLKFYMLRDDERFHTDRGTYGKKKIFIEIGRRLVERGVLTNDDDFWYLSKSELYRLLEGATTNMRIVRAKIDARRRNCDELEAGERRPILINGNSTIPVGLDDQSSALGEDGVLRGVGTSRGLVVGTARVIPNQREIGRVQKGEILVCLATDPGWTAVFMVAGGAIFETGGSLAHCSCISREYGIPAVQIVDATRLIEDGSTIEVNGMTGEVRILARPGEVPEPAR